MATREGGMKRFFALVAVVVGVIFLAVGMTALLKTGQTLLGILFLIAAGSLLACGLYLRFAKRRRRAKRSRSKRKPTSRKTQKAKPVKKQPPKKPAEKPKPEKKRPVEEEPQSELSEPVDEVEEEVDTDAEVQSLVEALKGTILYESTDAVATVKDATCTLTDDIYEIKINVEVAFRAEALTNEEASKSETNHVIAAVGDAVKALRSKLDKLGANHDVSADYDFIE